jgi:hypothetical protein
METKDLTEVTIIFLSTTLFLKNKNETLKAPM